MAGARRLILVDGSSSLYRAFFALPHLSNSRGIPTNAVLGFTTMLLKLLREEKPDAVAVAFDGPGPTRRHQEFANYKAQRPETPDSMVPQIPYVHRVLEVMHVPILMLAGEEADDILGAVAVRAAAEGYAVVLISGDKDLFQVVGDRVVVRDTMKERTWGPPEVKERYGIPPERIPDLLALMGDSIDNIPGVPGVGEKTARDLLQRFGSLEGVLDRVAEVPKPKLRDALRTHAEQARLSKRLATIRTDLTVPWTAGELERKAPDLPALLALCRELEFSRLIQQLEQLTL
ncbi:MAG TPA: 5'-3' exonuclease H3TH domain-containing protein [Candidatus Methylomirabilis sp.]|nr:5'-3' exonuclease H3TH domain-containing protein [Candidatus Methylomirabilis sp.]